MSPTLTGAGKTFADLRGVNLAECINILIPQFYCRLFAMFGQEAKRLGHFEKRVLLHLQVGHRLTHGVDLDHPI